MSIRTKLALSLALVAAVAAGATAATLMGMQRATLLQAEAERERLLLDNVARVARESRLANDPLMLLDHLTFLSRDREEVRGCRVKLSDRWQEIGAAPETPAAGADRRRLPAGDGEAEIAIDLDRAVLEARRRRVFRAAARNAAKAGGLVLLAGALFAWPLSRRMTRSILRIEEALGQLGEGRFDARVEVNGSDEIARLAREVNATAAQLQELDRMKKTFVASVTHELRSPLGAIVSHVKALLDRPDGLGPEGRESLGRVVRNAARLEHFVTSLLEMAKIERGKLDYFPRLRDPGGLARDTVEFFAPRSAEAGVALEAKIEPGLPQLKLDPDLIAQVLTNLVSNALKFTRRGGRVSVEVGRVGGGVELAVSDTGVGIPPEAQARLFKPFERARSGLAAPGAGLGLAICKAIADLHGGRLELLSEPGKGSRFSLMLKLP